MNTSIFKSIKSIGIYAVYIFLILELCARAALAYPKFYNFIRKGDYVSDSGWRLDWIKRKRAEQNFNFVEGFDVHHPTRGWMNKANVKDLDVYNKRTVNLNAKGLRGFKDYTYERTPGMKRIIILGESFTFGTEVGDRENYPYLLDQLLPNVEVLNMGVHGYGYDQMLLYLKEEGVKYQPDIVIIPFLKIDKKRSLMAFRDYAKPVFKLVNGELQLTNTPIPTPEQFYKREIFRSKLWDIVKFLKRKIDVKTGRYQIEEEHITRVLLNVMVKTIREANAVPMILYLEGIRDSRLKQDLDSYDRAFFDYWEKDQRVPCIYALHSVNLLNAVRLTKMNVDRVLYFRKFHHFSPTENAMIAYAIKEFLTRYKFVDI